MNFSGVFQNFVDNSVHTVSTGGNGFSSSTTIFNGPTMSFMAPIMDTFSFMEPIIAPFNPFMDMFFGPWLPFGNVTNNITGSQFGDSIFGGHGPGTKNTLRGGAGDDFIKGGTFANNTLRGGDGNDVIWGGLGGRNDINGGKGDDTIITRGGKNKITLGEGNDFINAVAGESKIDARTLKGRAEILANQNDTILFNKNTDLSKLKVRGPVKWKMID